ncbi:hypothetical protein VP01_690g1 [Puccinia sorghi]|uniref:Uncharacterized protein n=1 Tax=Puccinia sorghi TaxID=27349 RepID=A0A0L6UEA7_9BASI|nr:hypothetical protein VP01_690g1 [Puccinia sorghi]
MSVKKLFSINAQNIWIANFSLFNFLIKISSFHKFISSSLTHELRNAFRDKSDCFLFIFMSKFHIISEMFRKKHDLWHFPGSARNGFVLIGVKIQYAEFDQNLISTTGNEAQKWESYTSTFCLFHNAQLPINTYNQQDISLPCTAFSLIGWCEGGLADMQPCTYGMKMFSQVSWHCNLVGLRHDTRKSQESHRGNCWGKKEIPTTKVPVLKGLVMGRCKHYSKRSISGPEKATFYILEVSQEATWGILVLAGEKVTHTCRSQALQLLQPSQPLQPYTDPLLKTSTILETSVIKCMDLKSFPSSFSFLNQHNSRCIYFLHAIIQLEIEERTVIHLNNSKLDKSNQEKNVLFFHFISLLSNQVSLCNSSIPKIHIPYCILQLSFSFLLIFLFRVVVVGLQRGKEGCLSLMVVFNQAQLELSQILQRQILIKEKGKQHRIAERYRKTGEEKEYTACKFFWWKEKPFLASLKHQRLHRSFLLVSMYSQGPKSHWRAVTVYPTFSQSYTEYPCCTAGILQQSLKTPRPSHTVSATAKPMLMPGTSSTVKKPQRLAASTRRVQLFFLFKLNVRRMSNNLAMEVARFVYLYQNEQPENYLCTQFYLVTATDKVPLNFSQSFSSFIFLFQVISR